MVQSDTAAEPYRRRCRCFVPSAARRGHCGASARGHGARGRRQARPGRPPRVGAGRSLRGGHNLIFHCHLLPLRILYLNMNENGVRKQGIVGPLAPVSGACPDAPVRGGRASILPRTILVHMGNIHM